MTRSILLLLTLLLSQSCPSICANCDFDRSSLAPSSGGLNGWLRAGSQGELRRNVLAWRMNRFRNNSTVFYHGTNTAGAAGIRGTGINPLYGRPCLDFGQGFYTTTSRFHAVERAQWMARYAGGSAEILTFRVANRSLGRLSSRSFGSPNGAWASFVGRMRGGGTHAFDIVSGPAMRRMGPPIQAWPYPLYNQTSFHTQRAADLLFGGLR